MRLALNLHVGGVPFLFFAPLGGARRAPHAHQISPWVPPCIILAKNRGTPTNVSGRAVRQQRFGRAGSPGAPTGSGPCGLSFALR